MVTNRVRNHLYLLDDIYNDYRKNLGNHIGKMLPLIIEDYSVYWRSLEDNDFYGLEDYECDELYFFFNEKLLDIARSHFDFYWLIYHYDNQPLFRNGREPLPFFWSSRRRAARHRYNKSLRDAKKVRSLLLVN